jgi:hypothetical protein
MPNLPKGADMTQPTLEGAKETGGGELLGILNNSVSTDNLIYII